MICGRERAALWKRWSGKPTEWSKCALGPPPVEERRRDLLEIYTGFTGKEKQEGATELYKGREHQKRKTPIPMHGI